MYFKFIIKITICHLHMLYCSILVNVYRLNVIMFKISIFISKYNYMLSFLISTSSRSSGEFWCVCEEDDDSSSPKSNSICRGESSRIRFKRPRPT